MKTGTGGIGMEEAKKENPGMSEGRQESPEELLERRDQDGGARRIKGRSRGWLAAAVIFVILIGAALAARFLRGETPAAEGGPEAVPVEVAAAAVGDVEEVSKFTGRVAPRVEVNVLPKVSGRIRAVSVDVGDRVRTGQVLVQLDDTEIAAQVRQAEAALAVAEAGARAAAANLEDARRNLERVKELYDAGAATLQQLEQAQLRYDQAAAGVNEAQVEQARAALGAARIQLDNTVITAPLTGIVAARFAEAGEMASPGQPLLTLVDIDQVQVEISVTEAEVNKLRRGQEVPVTVAAAGEKPLTGRITSLAPAADTRSKMFPVKITLPNRDHRLKPGMFAGVGISTEVRRQVLRVPVAAVLEKEEGTFVYVVEDGCARARQVETGLSDGKFTEIKSGLREGEQVVVSGQEFLVDGVKAVVKGVLP
ncbi:MAG: efflux RND transporter periplasmic adaptor subunit [Bacillota bacterium]|nr:efflux RND transporter periplasmic adaptor subunit [Bacillota bacterium]